MIKVPRKIIWEAAKKYVDKAGPKLDEKKQREERRQELKLPDFQSEWDNAVDKAARKVLVGQIMDGQKNHPAVCHVLFEFQTDVVGAGFEEKLGSIAFFNDKSMS